MKKPTLKTLLYGAIAVCVTVMLVLFAGSLSGDDDKMNSAPVKDLLFKPDSVVQLTAENQQLSDAYEETNEKLDELTAEYEDVRGRLREFNSLAKVLVLLNEGNDVGAKNLFDGIDVSNENENIKALYDLVSQQIK